MSKKTPKKTEPKLEGVTPEDAPKKPFATLGDLFNLKKEKKE